MNWTDRSLILKPHPQQGSLTNRDCSLTATNKPKRKGISLSKELDPMRTGRSTSSFINIVQKDKKPTVIKRRQIKLLVKAKNEFPFSQPHDTKQNNGNSLNYPNTHTKMDYMDVISSQGIALNKIRLKKNAKSPTSKPYRSHLYQYRNNTPIMKLL